MDAEPIFYFPRDWIFALIILELLLIYLLLGIMFPSYIFLPFKNFFQNKKTNTGTRSQFKQNSVHSVDLAGDSSLTKEEDINKTNFPEKQIPEILKVPLLEPKITSPAESLKPKVTENIDSRAVGEVLQKTLQKMVDSLNSELGQLSSETDQLGDKIRQCGQTVIQSCLQALEITRSALKLPAPACPEFRMVPEEELATEFWHDVEVSCLDKSSDDRVRKVATDLTAIFSEGRRLLYTEAYKTTPEQKFILIPEEEKTPGFYFIGDLHGDVLALETAIQFAKQDVVKRGLEESPRFFFLGDLFDRGKNDKEVLLRVIELLVGEPERHGFVIGNHDEGLAIDQVSGHYLSSVHPSEFSELMNAEPQNSPWRELVSGAMDFFRKAPRAVLLPDGLLAAHGGVPHTDLHDSIISAASLEDPRMLEDFVWTRLHKSAPKKIPNRSTRGCEIGWADFNAFCAKCDKSMGRRVVGMIRGHDHLEQRHAFLEKYQEHPVLTINTISSRLESETGDFQRPVCVARHEAGSMPQVFGIIAPLDLLEKINGDHTPDRSKLSTAG